MTSSGKKIYGLIGYPVAHSLSPAMHNAAFAYLKIDAEYLPFPLRETELEEFLKNSGRKNIFGLNVTVPYKEKVIPFLEKVDSEAELIGAVNTIRFREGRSEGFNTDGKGFLRQLTQDLGFVPQGKNIAILGAGGASRAISVSLSRNNPASVSIYDIEQSKLSALISHLKGNFKKTEFKAANSIEALEINKCSLLVNATPVGMKETDPVLVDSKYFHNRLLVYDLIYNPAQTKLLKAAKENGAGVSNGLGLLLYQGAEAFKLWTATEAPIAVMRKALEEALGKICSGKP